MPNTAPSIFFSKEDNNRNLILRLRQRARKLILHRLQDFEIPIIQKFDRKLLTFTSTPRSSFYKNNISSKKCKGFLSFIQIINLIQLTNGTLYVKQQKQKYLKSRMTEQRIYHLKQIVWAKIDNYPWWPGKVTATLIQNRKKVYKINFFADPTYCHLFPEALSPFTQQPPSYVNFRQTDLKLRKAIQMAKKKNIENKSKLQQQADNDASPAEKIMHQPSAFQQTKLQSKHEIELAQKMLDNEPRFQRQNELIRIGQLLQTELDENNIIEVLNSQLVSRLTKQKGYSERKTAFSFIEKLKGTLLRKYKLHDLDSYYKKMSFPTTLPIINISQKSAKSSQNAEQQQPAIRRIHRLHRFKAHGKSSKNNAVSPKALCVRKIYNLLKGRNYQAMEAKQISVRLYQRLCQCSDERTDASTLRGQKEVPLSTKFKKNFVVLLNWLKNSDQRFQEQNSPNLYQNYSDLYMNSSSNEQKRDDEQKSRATTIPNMEQ